MSEAIKQALALLQNGSSLDVPAAIEVLKQAEKQVPVAYIDHVSGKPKFINGYVVQTDYDIPLYTAPPRKEWVGLTDDEVWVAYEKGMYEEMWFARAVEAKLKEKNT